jgi:hypothetical protein
MADFLMMHSFIGVHRHLEVIIQKLQTPVIKMLNLN